MNNIMQYKGYVGSVEFSENDGILFGKVQGIRSLISYEGTSVQELLDDFHGAVDDYLASCAEEGYEPEAAFNDRLNIRFKNPDTHRRIAIYAMTHDQTVNNFINDTVEEKLNAIGA